MPWVHIGTVVGAVAAIGGLVFTGVATYYGAVVSRSQLEQSREDAEERSSQQAARVSYWWQGGTSGSRLHILNRSPDPVTDVTLTLVLFQGKLLLNPRVVQIAVPTLAPCSEAVLNEANLKKAAGRLVSVGPDDRTGMTNLHFADRNGKSWVRSATGLERS